MAVIDQYRGILTVLIEIEVVESTIEETLQNLKDFTLSFVKLQPGFISANLHRSEDDTKIINYAQWKNKEDFERFLSLEETQQQMKELKIIKTNITLMKVALAT